jgi:hypothetical protein
MSSLSFSQNVTNNLVCIPKSTAQKIAQDLIKKDLCDSTLVSTQFENSLLLKKINYQNEVINQYINKEELYKNNASNYQEQLKFKDLIIGNQAKSIDKAKKQTRLAYISSGAAFILYVFLVR